jgi:hypothetical protein
MNDAAFRRDRLQVAATKLGGRLREVKAQEEDRRRRLAYDKRKAERDELATELERLYPTVAKQLASLMERIAASDREIEYINGHALPHGAKPLLSAELVARGMRGFVNNSVQAPRITQQLRLPAFRPDQHDPYAWPRAR